MARNTLGLACSWVSGICISVNASSGELCFVKTVAKKNWSRSCRAVYKNALGVSSV